MILTLDQLLLNYTTLSKDGKLYNEKMVKLAYELGKMDKPKKKK